MIVLNSSFLPKIFFTVTNDLSYDQRMIRICTSLAAEGFEVVLVGRKLKKSIQLKKQNFCQKRFNVFFDKGFLFYAEFNIRLFFYLLFKKFDAVCSIDLDTILPGILISKIKKTKRIYDAHELFCEMAEIKRRPGIYRIWKFIESVTVPHYQNGYTVNAFIASEFKRMYGVNYSVIRNIAPSNTSLVNSARESFIIYQGAVNEGRCFETLIPAMRKVNVPLYIFGDGNFMSKAKQLVKDYKLENKVKFFGMTEPSELLKFTSSAIAGLTLFENKTMNNYYSLANRFFHYMQSATPQICMEYPVYKEINDKYNIALLIPEATEENISNAINEIVINKNLWNTLHQNCKKASQELNWQNESLKLISFYKTLFGKESSHSLP